MIVRKLTGESEGSNKLWKSREERGSKQYVGKGIIAWSGRGVKRKRKREMRIAEPHKRKKERKGAGVNWL